MKNHQLIIACTLAMLCTSSIFVVDISAQQRKNPPPANSALKEQNNSGASKQVAAQKKNNNSKQPKKVDDAQIKETKDVVPSSNKKREDDKQSLSTSAEAAKQTAPARDQLSINVETNTNTIVKIPMFPGGVTTIEFPANDGGFSIHPGDENLVTFDCEERNADNICVRTDLNKPLVLRPTLTFRKHADQPIFTTYNLQRASGATFTFICLPADSPAEHTSYLVLRYNPDDIRRSRLAQGLAIDLNAPQTDGSSPNGAHAIIKPGQAQPPLSNNKPSVRSSDVELREVSYKDARALPPGASVVNATAQGESILPDNLTELTVAALQRFGSHPQRKISFSKPVHGLSVAVAPNAGGRTDNIVIETVALKNVLPFPIRLCDEQPELAIKNSKNTKEPAVMLQDVEILNTATTAQDDYVLQPGVVYYFSFAYRAPVLGAKQSLVVSFAQTNASDEPVEIDLTVLAR